jgi:hypothetical protein
MTIGDAEAVQRFEPRMVGFCDRPHEAGMYADLHGHYVLHSAYAELAAELDREKMISANRFLLVTIVEKKQQAAESQLAELRGALKDLIHEYVKTLEAGRDRIIFHGGECDPVDVMERSDPALIRAKRTLAAADGGISE